MKSIDPEIDAGKLVDIISDISSEPSISNQSLMDKNTKQRFTRNNRKRSKKQKRIESMISDMKSVDYATRREAMWTGSQERSLLPTDSFSSCLR